MRNSFSRVCRSNNIIQGPWGRSPVIQEVPYDDTPEVFNKKIDINDGPPCYKCNNISGEWKVEDKGRRHELGPNEHAPEFTCKNCNSSPFPEEILAEMTDGWIESKGITPPTDDYKERIEIERNKFWRNDD